MPGKWSRKRLVWVGSVAAALLLALLAARLWVVPALIAREVGARLGARVEFRGWWLSGRSAGLVGLVLRETGPGSPGFVKADRVTTDLTVSDVLRGRFTPRRVTVSRPQILVRIARDGRLLTRFGATPGSSSDSSGTVPVVVANGAEVTLRQEGRPEMHVKNVVARLGPDGDGLNLAVSSNDPQWGPFEGMGQFSGDFATGRVNLKSGAAGVSATPAKVKAIPFVPAEVWDYVAPTGDVDVRLNVEYGGAQGAGVRVVTEIGLRGTAVRSPNLELSASGATGRVVVNGAVVTLEGVSGKAVDGRVTAAGQLDFGRSPALIDVALDLDRVDVTKTPKSWQLDETGVTGRLTGKARLLASLKPEGVDLSGSTGDAVVEGGTIQGIPVKSLRLSMTASGNDLRYDTPKEKASGASRSAEPGAVAAALLVAFQPPDAAKKADPQTPAPTEPKRPVFQLPKALSTHLELEDVDVAQLIAKVEFLLGFPFPLPITGKLALKADATIPLGRLHVIKEFAFHGDLTLTAASVYRVDLGRLSARIDLKDGVLDLSDLRGQLIDHPSGGPRNPPPPVAVDLPTTGPIPPGMFRGSLRAELDPPGKLTARFEGTDLPLGELAAPALPRPTPLSGLATLKVNALADLRSARDPAAWTVTGSALSQKIRFEDAALDRVAVSFDLKDGRLDVPELTATLGGRPLVARADVELKRPHRFTGKLDVTGWDLAQVLAWRPGVVPSSVSGTLSARAEARGTLTPRKVETSGRGRFERIQGGPVAVGDVPFAWDTKGDTVVVSVTDARPFGGRVDAEATVPLSPGLPVKGSATLTNVDTAKISAAVPGGALVLSGKAGGRIDFTLPPEITSMEASVRLTSTELTVQGIPAEKVHATVKARRGVLDYEISAESLGGTVRLKGDFPISAAPIRRESNGEFQAVGFSVERLLKAEGVGKAADRLSGRGAVDANVRALLSGPGVGLYAHGIAEVRDLHWGGSTQLGRVRAEVAVTPTGWRVEPLSGDLLGGNLSGYLWGSGPPNPGAHRPLGFDVRVERAPLKTTLAFASGEAHDVVGFGNLHVAGTLGETFRASADYHVSHARVAGLPVGELRIPGELVMAVGGGSGTLRLRRWTARIAGGQARGDASFRLGEDRSFRSDLVLTDLDLETIARARSEARRPATGRISGRIHLDGTDPQKPRSYRGRLDLDLDDASLVAVPVFREIDRFLGASRGGLFEHGDLIGTIANRQINVDPLTLEGRLAQLHVTGTVGFDGQLNLVVLVNTNQIIPQTGQALLGAIPGLANVRGRDDEAMLRVANYLSNRLLKFRVTGTADNPSVSLDPSVLVAGPAVGFFSGVLKLPFGMVK